MVKQCAQTLSFTKWYNYVCPDNGCYAKLAFANLCEMSDEWEGFVPL